MLVFLLIFSYMAYFYKQSAWVLFITFERKNMNAGKQIGIQNHIFSQTIRNADLAQE